MSEPKSLRVSWSALRNHGECHQRSYLIREGKRQKVTNVRNFFGGMVVDRIMRDLLDNPIYRSGDHRALVTATMDELESTERGSGNIVRWRNAADRDEVRAFCTELITRLVPILDEHVLPYPYEHGKWFKVPMDIPGLDGKPREIVLTGEMDLIVDNDGPVVWDLKGTADDSYWRKVVGQLTFYDMAIYASSGRKTRFTGLIQPMCTERLLAFEVTDTARSTMGSRIVAYAHDVWREEKTCTDATSKCGWCEVRHACSRFAPAATDVFGDLAAGLRQAAGDAA